MVEPCVLVKSGFILIARVASSIKANHNDHRLTGICQPLMLICVMGPIEVYVQAVGGLLNVVDFSFLLIPVLNERLTRLQFWK